MLLCRFSDGGRRAYGRVADDRGGQVIPVEYDPASGRWAERGRARPLGEVTLLPPAEPGKIACVALNYAGGPGGPGGRGAAAPAGRRAGAASCSVVLKPASSVAGPGDQVCHPGADWDLAYEAELAVVIKVRCKRVPPGYAAEVVAGYTCANDITAYARTADGDRGADGYPPVWAKHFDGCTPLGPWLATGLDPADAGITCTVDGEVRQSGSTRLLIMPVHEAIAAVSEHMTLLPGDVILTGTPPGSGPLSVGSKITVSIEGIGTLENVITASPAFPR